MLSDSDWPNSFPEWTPSQKSPRMAWLLWEKVRLDSCFFSLVRPGWWLDLDGETCLMNSYMDPSVFSHPSKHHSHQFRFEYVSRMCLPASMPIKIYPINTMLDPSNGQQTALVTNVSNVSLDTHLMVHGVAAQCCPEKCPCWCLGMVLNFLAIWSALEGKKNNLFSVGCFAVVPAPFHQLQRWLRLQLHRFWPVWSWRLW